MMFQQIIIIDESLADDEFWLNATELYLKLVSNAEKFFNM